MAQKVSNPSKKLSSQVSPSVVVALMDSYVTFVRGHKELVRPLEGLLRTAVYFLPSRYVEDGAGEITTEAALSASSLLTLLHDMILLDDEALAPDQQADMTQQGGGHTTENTRKDAWQRNIGVLLTSLSYTEVLLEKLAKRLGRSEQMILALEAVKAALRLLLLTFMASSMSDDGTDGDAINSLLMLQGGRYSPRPTVDLDGAEEQQQPQHDNVSTLGSRSQTASSSSSSSSSFSSSTSAATWPTERREATRGRRTGRRFLYRVPVEVGAAAAPSGDSILGCHKQPEGKKECCQSAAALHDVEADVVQRVSVMLRKRRLMLLGEVLYILRPVVYAALVCEAKRRLAQEAQGWRRLGAFVGSALIDCASARCTSLAMRYGAKPTKEQAAELHRRRMLWMLYLLRSPLFELAASPVARGIEARVRGVPLLGGVASYSLQMLVYIQNHYFYISAS